MLFAFIYIIFLSLGLLLKNNCINFTSSLYVLASSSDIKSLYYLLESLHQGKSQRFLWLEAPDHQKHERHNYESQGSCRVNCSLRQPRLSKSFPRVTSLCSIKKLDRCWVAATCFATGSDYFSVHKNQNTRRHYWNPKMTAMKTSINGHI